MAPAGACDRRRRSVPPGQPGLPARSAAPITPVALTSRTLSAADPPAPADPDDAAALRAAVARHVWFHSIVLRPGLVTPGSKSAELLEAEAAAILAPLQLAGRSLLDIGAWNGFWSFAARRAGAARVVALDHVTWRDPRFRGRETFELARAALGLHVEAWERDATTLEPADGPFDAVLCLGVFYHLHDPIPLFRRLRAITGEVLVIETHQDMLQTPEPAMRFYPGRELADDPSNWWGPNPALVFHLLRDAGFGHVLYRDHPVYGRVRGIFHAFPGSKPGPILRAVPQGAVALNAAAAGALALP